MQRCINLPDFGLLDTELDLIKSKIESICKEIGNTSANIDCISELFASLYFFNKHSLSSKEKRTFLMTIWKLKPLIAAMTDFINHLNPKITELHGMLEVYECSMELIQLEFDKIKSLHNPEQDFFDLYKNTVNNTATKLKKSHRKLSRIWLLYDDMKSTFDNQKEVVGRTSATCVLMTAVYKKYHSTLAGTLFLASSGDGVTLQPEEQAKGAPQLNFR